MMGLTEMSDGGNTLQVRPDREIRLGFDIVKEEHNLPVMVSIIIIGVDFVVRLHIQIHGESVIFRHPYVSRANEVFQSSDIRSYLLVVEGIVKVGFCNGFLSPVSGKQYITRTRKCEPFLYYRNTGHPRDAL